MGRIKESIAEMDVTNAGDIITTWGLYHQYSEVIGGTQRVSWPHGEAYVDMSHPRGWQEGDAIQVSVYVETQHAIGFLEGKIRGEWAGHGVAARILAHAALVPRDAEEAIELLTSTTPSVWGTL